MNTKQNRPGTKAEISGEYKVANRNGKVGGSEYTIVKGETFPATPSSGQSFRLVHKAKHKH